MSQKKGFLSFGAIKVPITLADEERQNMEDLLAATWAVTEAEDGETLQFSDESGFHIAPAATQKKEVKVYDAEGFLDAAQKYMDESPPDLVQACEKLWATMAYLLKKQCLDVGYKLTGHKTLRQMAEWIFDKKFELLSADVAADGMRLFKKCERFHRDCYEGSKAEMKNEMEKILRQLKEFLPKFNQIKLDALKLVLEKKEVEFQGSDDVKFEKFKMEVEDMGLKYTKTQWKIHVSKVHY